jgi:hypothetical protein
MLVLGLSVTSSRKRSGCANPAVYDFRQGPDISVYLLDRLLASTLAVRSLYLVNAMFSVSHNDRVYIFIIYFLLVGLLG